MTLIIAIVAMIEGMRTKWISAAFRPPSAVPTARPAAITRDAGRPSRAARSAATYCDTDAVAANEMSMPPETSTTKRPIAMIACTE